MHLPFIIYIRVSRIGGRSAADGYISKVLQREACDRIAQRIGVTVHAVFKEENLSGTSLERPRFQEALQLVRDGVCGGIIVMNLDRFSRDTADGLTVIKDIEAHGGSVYDESGAISCRTSNDELNATSRLMIATREVGSKREQWARTIDHALKGGRHLQVNYGYERGTWKGRSRVLVANAEEHPVVTRIFTERKAGHSWKGIADALNADGILPRPFRRAVKDAEGDRTDEWEVVQGQWRGNAVRDIVQSRVYLGVAFNGDHEHPGAHQPLVTQKLWNDANDVRLSTAGRREGHHADHLLKGIARCASCGYVMGRTQRDGGRYAYYQCGDNAAQPCPHPTSVPAALIEQYVDDAMVEAAAQLKRGRPVQDDSALQAAEAALQDAEAEYAVALDRQDKAHGKSVAQRRVIDRNVDEKEAQLEAASVAHDRALQASKALRLPIKVADLPKRYPSLPVAERRHLISLMFSCVAVRPPRAWREDVAARAALVHAGTVPGGVSIFDHVTGLDWDPAGAGVVAG